MQEVRDASMIEGCTEEHMSSEQVFFNFAVFAVVFIIMVIPEKI